MKEYGGWKFPDHEVHLLGWLRKVNEKVDGRLRYQGKKIDASMAACRNFRTAIDVGAHIGLWSYYLARKFEHVHSFEPVEEHRQCFEENMVTCSNVTVYPVALGDVNDHVSIFTANTSSGDSWVNGPGDIPRMRLDDLEFADVDFIKIDCEGSELLVLRGAEALILRDRPTICVEQKPGRAQKFGLPETGAVDYLRGLGAEMKASLSGDYVFAFPE